MIILILSIFHGSQRSVCNLKCKHDTVSHDILISWSLQAHLTSIIIHGIWFNWEHFTQWQNTCCMYVNMLFQNMLFQNINNTGMIIEAHSVYVQWQVSSDNYSIDENLQASSFVSL